MLLPDQVHKHLGVQMIITDNFDAEKEYVLGEMQRWLESSNTNEVLSPSLKELAIKVGIISILRYSASWVPWSRSEQNKLEISKMWSTGCMQALYKKAARIADATVLPPQCS